VSRWLRIRPWLGVIAGLTLFYGVQNLPIGPRINLLLSPFMEMLEKPARWWLDVRLWVRDRRILQNEIMDLRIDAAHLASMEQELHVLQAENRQLRSLLNLPAAADYRWQAARVLGRSPDERSERLVLRIFHPVHTNDVVVSSAGLIGLVTAVQGRYAVVRTILDASVAVPATLHDRSLAALIRGQGDALRVDFVPWKRAPKFGSVLVTSGTGGIFPAGIPVARVLRSYRVPGSLFAKIRAEPLADWRAESWLSIASRRRR